MAKKEKNKEDLEKEWKKLRKKLKDDLKSKSEKEEESELEEKTEPEEREEEIQDDKFSDFLQSLGAMQTFSSTIEPTESTAPVLERVETLPQSIILEQDIANSPISTETKERDEQIRYDSRINYTAPWETEENKERLYELNIEPPVLRPIENSQDFSKQELFNPFDMRIHNEDIYPEMIDGNEIERERKLPFEEQTKKYKKFKSTLESY